MPRFLAVLLFIVCALFAPAKAKHGCITRHKTCVCASVQHSSQQYNFTYSLLTGKDSIAKRKHKLIAALLAFPFPFGVIGLHRVYLGTSAKVPFLYFVTIGGVFGVLPFVDFVLILLTKDVNTTYAHNHKVFMWSRQVAQ